MPRTPVEMAEAAVYADRETTKLLGEPGDDIANYLREMSRVAAVMLKLLAASKVVRDILKLQPAPELGGWNWPSMVADLETVIAEAEGRSAT